MKLEAKQRLAANWQKDLELIQDASIKNVVLKLGSVVNIQSIGSDLDFGCQVNFKGKTRSSYQYGTPVLNANELEKIGSLVKGFVVELSYDLDSHEFILMLSH